MDVRYSEEQVALRETVARLADRHGPRTVQSLDDADRVAALESAIAATGLRDLRTALEGAAPLGSGVETAIVAEELGRGLVDVPFVGSVLAGDLRRRAGAEPSTCLETVVLSRELSAVGRRAPNGAGLRDLRAVDARGIAQAVLLERSGADRVLGAVSLDCHAFATDLTRQLAAPTPATPVKVGTLSANDIRAWTALALALTSADLVGVMRAVVDITRDYAGERRQYGVPIGSFQAVQHLIADAHVAVEGSASLTRHASWAVDALEPGEALAACAAAKAYTSRAARKVCETAIQVHGGIGNTWECILHVYLRRALLSIDLFGGVDVNLERVIQHRGVKLAAPMPDPILDDPHTETVNGL